MLPATVKGIERYLGSGMIKGIGPVMAKRLVAQFKEETLSVIDNNTKNEVSGIGDKKGRDDLTRAWEDRKKSVSHDISFFRVVE